MKTPNRLYQLVILATLFGLGGLTVSARWMPQTLRESRLNPFCWAAKTTPAVKLPTKIVVTASSAAAATHSLFAATDAESESLALAPAQAGGSFNLTQTVVPGGGGASSGGNQATTGSIGQSALGTSNAGNFSVAGGFWGGGGQCATITINPTTLPNGQIGVAYSQQLSQTGGNGAIVWSSIGTLPNNVTLNPATGLLAGTPTAAGTFNFTVRATDANSCLGEHGYTLTIGTCPAITISPASLPGGLVGSAYSQQFTQSGGAGTITWSRSAGALPAGLNLDPSSGVLSGTPSGSGTFNFSITAMDSNGCTGTRAYTVAINCPTLTVNPATVPVARKGVPYNQSFTQTGGVGTVSFALTGSLPTGLSFNAAAALLSGTPTAEGSFNFTITATDAAACNSTRNYTLIVLPRAVVKADFDGDGKTDLSVFRPGAATPVPNWFVTRSSNGAALTQQWGAGYAPYNDTIVPGDYDGDGITDYAVWRGQDRIWYIRKSSDGAFILALWGANYAPYFDIPVPGDYDGDGKTDIAVFRRSGTWFVKRSSDGSFLIQNHGQQDDIPVPADYDGDGKTDFAIFRPSAVAPAPNWIILNSSTDTITSIQWGAGNAPYFDTPVPADYDGDGKADLAIWRGADSIWYIRKSSDGQFLLDLWGANYAPYFDIPTPGDYDGDGKADIAVFRRDGTWFIKRSSNGSFVIQTLGQQGDLPAPAFGVR